MCCRSILLDIGSEDGCGFGSQLAVSRGDIGKRLSVPPREQPRLAAVNYLNTVSEDSPSAINSTWVYADLDDRRCLSVVVPSPAKSLTAGIWGL